MAQEDAGRILIVEDDDATARLGQRRLERMGHSVAVCENAGEARQTIEREAVDLILLDQCLGNGRTGLEFFRELQRDGFGIPSILITGWPDESLIIEALRAGFRDFVTKSPAFLDYLPEAVSRVLAQVRLERQLAESEELHRVTLSNVSDTVLMTDEAGRFTYVCPHVAVNFGYSVDEVWAMETISALLGGELLDEQKLEHEKELRNLECDVRTRDGELGHFLVNVKRVSIQNSSVLYSFRNVTEYRNLQIQRERIFSDSLSLLGIFGFDGYFKRVNPTWETVFGYSVEELLAMPFMDLVHPEDVSVAKAEVESLSAGGQTVSFEIRCRCKDGGYRWILWNATPFPEQDVFYVTGHDITDRKRTESSLKEAHESFRTLVDSIEGIVWEADPETIQFDFVSRQSERLLGYAPEQWTEDADFWKGRVHPDDTEWVLDTCAAATRELRDHELEYRMISAEGKTVWFRDLVTVVSEGDRPVRLRGIMVDVTEKKRAQQRLAGQHAVTRILSEADSLNGAAEELLAALGQTFGWSVGELWTIEEEKAEIHCLQRWYVDREQAHDFELASTDLTFGPGEGLPGRVWKAGRSVWINDLKEDPGFARSEAAARSGLNAACAFPITLGNECFGVLEFFSRTIDEEDERLSSTMHAVCSQIAQFIERRRTEASLRDAEDRYRQAQKMEAIGLLAGGIAHDFNNLLTIILGFAECLVEEAPRDGGLHGLAEEIHSAAQRAAALTHQLLAFSRRQVLEPVVLDLNELVSGTQRLLRRVIGEDIELTVRLSSDLRPVHADPAQLEQIIMNLAINARDAMPAGGRLIIETQNAELSRDYTDQYSDVSAGEYVMLAISDTGCGMDPETKARAFEPFFTTKEQGKGTGMGLATVYGIVKQSGGHVALYSERGQGTTFKVYLPGPMQEPAAPENAAAADLLPGGRETILLVEDEDGVRKLARRVLEKQGYNVLEAENADSALKIAARHSGAIDLLLTDVVMPNTSGKELAEMLASTRPETPVLYMSGYTGEAIAHHGVLEEGVVLLQKPFTQASITQKVREVLDGAGANVKPRSK